MKRVVCGVGINDAWYPVQVEIEGRQITCPFYSKWKNMLKRCYDKNFLSKNPTYAGCSVCTEWLTFSNFRAWMAEQDWKGKQLDKDLIKRGNKIYHPDFCVFVSSVVNSFSTDSARNRGSLPIGVCMSRSSYIATCGNPLTKKREYLGSYVDEHSAHKAWLNRKMEIANQLADLEPDERVARSLRKMYIGFVDSVICG